MSSNRSAGFCVRALLVCGSSGQPTPLEFDDAGAAITDSVDALTLTSARMEVLQ